MMTDEAKNCHTFRCALRYELVGNQHAAGTDQMQLPMWLAGVALLAGAVQADAQPRLLDLHEMNFDMWCQEHEHLPPKRCDKRLPQDDSAFQAYAYLLETY